MTLDLWNHGVIEAHAGTGKTFTIVALVLRLLRERRLRLTELLVVTYTEKAAGELVDRLRRELSRAIEAEADVPLREHLEACRQDLAESLIGTIHGISLRLLQAYPFESGTPFSTRLVDDGEGLEAALREVLRAGTWRPAGAPGLGLAELAGERGIEEHFEAARALAAHLLDPATALEPPDIEEAWDSPEPAARQACLQARWARAAASRWEARKRAEGLLSFQDMLARMAEAVGREGFRGLLRRKVRVGIIDEFQDTSRLQWSIFRTWFLAEDALSSGRDTRPLLFLVGDPKQSIYSFQGADVGAYLEACDHLAGRHGAQSLRLVDNWRSLPGLIEGYNALLSPRTLRRERSSGRGKNKVTELVEEAWTWFEDPSPRLSYAPGEQAGAPDRGRGPEHPLPFGLDAAPVRLFVSDAPASQARAEYAQAAAGWIRALRGRRVDLPEGRDWVPHRLDWGDFAVVVGARSAVWPFARAFDRAGIPWALYKQEGVFASRAAQELRTALTAAEAGPAAAGPWRLALCTRVADGDEAVLERLHDAARRGRWERLFRELEAGTGIRSRLLAGEDGDKEWMDWRQCCAHALDWLVSGAGNLPELVEHLGRLARSEERAADDRNLHARATDRGRVQVLTMHASKGLEFPVVFVADTKGANRFPAATWIRDGRFHAMPPVGRQDPGDPWREGVNERLDLAAEARALERRRLHYVALTRPKLLLVSQCFARRKKDGDWAKVDPLSDALAGLLDDLPPCVATLPPPPAPEGEAEAPASGAPRAAVRTRGELRELELPSRMRVQTSYSQIQRESSAHLALDGRTARSEEPPEEEGETVASAADAWLPRGARTGDALHEILEAWLAPSRDLGWVAAGDAPPTGEGCPAVAEVLELHGLLRGLGPERSAALCGRVEALLRAALLAPIDLGGEGSLRLCDLAPEDRRPEVEFHRPFGDDGGPCAAGDPARGWMVGYVDLLFRHRARWHVLEWKTTSLPEWGGARLDEAMREHGYALQADLYRQVLETSLPGQPTGRSVYVFLRAFADPATAPWGFWVSPPEVQDLATPALRGWLHARRERKAAP